MGFRGISEFRDLKTSEFFKEIRLFSVKKSQKRL